MQPWANLSIFAVAQFFMLIGLFGLIVPIFPGIMVMWLAALGYGLLSGFSPVGVIMFVLMTVVMLIDTVVDNILMGAGARKGGASWGAIIASTIVGILGTLIFPPIGGLIGAPLAVLLWEYVRLRDWNQAWQALRGLLTGWLASFIVRFGVGLVMMVLWWIWVWKG